jgi:hypothetical protein
MRLLLSEEACFEQKRSLGFSWKWLGFFGFGLFILNNSPVTAPYEPQWGC